VSTTGPAADFPPETRTAAGWRPAWWLSCSGA